MRECPISGGSLNTEIAFRFILYRMYIIWSRNLWICLLPTLSIMAGSIGGIGICITFSQLAVGENVYVSIAQPYIITALGANLL